ncbi:MAG: hypothetical protein IJU75_05290 [Clostridia bacterium]|nr:hypothetical protein [Clostridia bacterium]
MNSKRANRIFIIFLTVTLIAGALIVQWNRIGLFLNTKHVERLISRHFEVVGSTSSYDISLLNGHQTTRYIITVIVKGSADNREQLAELKKEYDSVGFDTLNESSLVYYASKGAFGSGGPEQGMTYHLIKLICLDVRFVPPPDSEYNSILRLTAVIPGCLLLYLKKISYLVLSRSGSRRASALYVYECSVIALLSVTFCWLFTAGFFITSVVLTAAFAAVLHLTEVIVMKPTGETKASGFCALTDFLTCGAFVISGLGGVCGLVLIILPRRFRLFESSSVSEMTTDRVIFLSVLLTAAFASSMIKKQLCRKKYPNEIKDGLNAGTVFSFFNLAAVLSEISVYYFAPKGDSRYPAMLIIILSANLLALAALPLLQKMKHRMKNE